MLALLGADEEPSFLGLEKTPERVAAMFVDELLSSYQEGAQEALRRKFTVFPSQGECEMVTMSGIPFSSLCAHHLLPFSGHACVGYLPGKTLVGLSKIPRVVKFFSRKLQMQERMTTEIADFLDVELSPRAVIVLLEARHLCMECRGVEVPNVSTRTSALRGIALTDPSVKSEFYTLLGSTRS